MNNKFFKLVSKGFYVLLASLFLFSCNNTVNKNVKVDNDKDIVILFTNDVHCAVDDNIGYASLKYYYDNVKKEDVYTALVDAGDFSQGAPIGSLSKGKNITAIMNKVGYDFVVPGNHEFDYGMQGFKDICSELNNVICSCNIIDLRNKKTMLNPYKILTFGNKKVAFIGVTTPMAFTMSAPYYFQDENGKYIYSFCEDETGDALVKCIQKNVDEVLKEGVDYVILVGHLGETGIPTKWQTATLLSKLSGVDFCVDGHSHEVYINEITDKTGKEVKFAQTGTKFIDIGKLTIKKDGEFLCEMIDKVEKNADDNVEVNEKGNAVDKETTNFINDIRKQYEEMLDEVIVKDNKVDLIVNDINTGKRLIRKEETNLGDLCADAFKDTMGADIGIMNAGGIRTDINKGDITYNDCAKVFPFFNQVCLVKIKGATIVDALEWGARKSPGENGGLLQVSGITYTIDTTIPSPCVGDEKDNFVAINGERRVKDVKVNGDDIDLDKYYTLASHDNELKKGGDGNTMFANAEFLIDGGMLDTDMLAEYIKKVDLNDYSDVNGKGRINIIVEN